MSVNSSAVASYSSISESKLQSSSNVEVEVLVFTFSESVLWKLGCLQSKALKKGQFCLDFWVCNVSLIMFENIT